MKFRLVFCFVLIVLVSLSFVFVSGRILQGYEDVEGDFVKKEVVLRNGWNLVNGLPNPDWIDFEESEISEGDVKAVFGFNPVEQEYIRFFPEPESEKMEKDLIEFLIEEGSFWVYVDSSNEGEFDVSYFTLSSNEIEGRRLFSGWNFVGVIEEMLGEEDFESFKGSCEIKSSYFFEDDWKIFRNFDFGLLNKGVVVKVKENCELGTESEISPPSVPNEPSEIGLYPDNISLIIEEDIGHLGYLRTDEDGGEAVLLENEIESLPIYSGIYVDNLRAMVQDYSGTLGNENVEQFLEGNSGHFDYTLKIINPGFDRVYFLERFDDYYSIDYLWFSGDKLVSVGYENGEFNEKDILEIVKAYLRVYPSDVN